VRDVVCDFLQTAHQGFDPFKHNVQIFGQSVQFITGACNGQPSAQVTTHDCSCCFRHRIDASKDPAGDEKSACETQNDHDRYRPAPSRKHDIVETLTLVEIAPDQQTETARQLEDAHKRVMFRMIGGVRFVKPFVHCLCPAPIVECTGRQSRDIAGKGLSCKCRDEIKAGAGTPRAGVDDNYEPPDPSLSILFGETGDLGIDRIGNLLGDQPARVECEITEQKCRE